MALVKYNNNSLSSVTSAASVSSGAMTHIKTLTASSSSTLSFIDGSSDVVLDNTYPIYVFKFINIHPANDNTQFAFQVDTGTNTNYNQAITSTTFRTYHYEAGNDANINYVTGEDQAQGTNFQRLTEGNVGADNDQSCSGVLHLFNPSSTTFVKHFIGRAIGSQASDYASEFYSAGYINTTTALTRVQFKMLSGNIDSGTVKLYGIKDS